MEIRALSPHHSSGLQRAELQHRFGKRRSDRFVISVRNNLRNLWQAFFSGPRLSHGLHAVIFASNQKGPNDPGIPVGQRYCRYVWPPP
jgi:hypothetical protein